MSLKRSRVLFAVLVFSLCAVFGVSAGASALASAGASFDTAEVIAGARSLPVGGTLRVAMVPLDIDGKTARSTLRLERFDVFTADARIVLHTAAGDRLLPVPANVYLRGQIEGDAQSRVVLSVLESGEVRGLVTSTGRTWLMGSTTPGDLLQAREVDAGFELEEPGGGFRCEVDALGPAASRPGTGDEEVALASVLDAQRVSVGASDSGLAGTSNAVAGAFDHTAVIAIETDNEFLALAPFANNPALAIDYIADLIAYSSTIYVAELQTAWSLGYISLWGPLVPDPWLQSTPSCGLIDFGRYWNDNHVGVPRTVTHFLSGKSTNSGIAWVGVLCSNPFSFDAASMGFTGCAPPLTGHDNWGGGYGYTSGIDGNFNIGSPSVVWDIQAFTHEIGHNFNSGHTHCYQNIGGNAAAVDNCYAGQCGTTGCYCGATSLPGAAGAGSGTIMSYCHLLGGGNVSLTLGLGHPFGVMPERVPNRMRAHVLAQAGPSCLALEEPLSILFSNGFFSGNTSAWSVTAP